MAREQSREVTVAEARLPWHPGIEKRFKELNVDKTTWRALTDAIFPAAKTTESVIMALSYCRARQLDPFKRVVNIVPMWSKTANNGKGGYVDTVWPSIAELRTTATRTAEYAGCDVTEFGPDKTVSFEGVVKSAKVAKTVTFPEWARITVYRVVHGQRCAFPGPKVYWLESYGRVGGTALPNDMWERRAVGQLEKCAEAAALRKAFPEEVGNMLTAEEMEGQNFDPTAHGTAQPGQRRQAPQPPSPSAQQTQEAEDAKTIEGQAEDVSTEDQGDGEESVPGGEPLQEEVSPPAEGGAPSNPEDYLSELEQTLADCATEQDIANVRAMHDKRVDDLIPPDRDAADKMFEQAKRRVAKAEKGKG